jgi:hypothetical protein
MFRISFVFVWKGGDQFVNDFISLNRSFLVKLQTFNKLNNQKI